MTSFNFERFGKVIVCTVADNKKFYIQTAAVFAAIILVMAVFSLLVGQSDTSIGYVTTTTALIGTAAFIYFSTCLAAIVSNIPDKRKRIAAFMLPASKLEKFAARYVHLVVFIPLAALIGILASDMLQMLLSTIVTGDSYSIAGYFVHNISILKPQVGGVQMSGLGQIVFMIYSNSLFLAVGTIFRRHAWLKSNIVLGFSFITLLVLFVFAMKWTLDAIYGENNYSVVMLDSTWITVVEDTVIILLSLFNYWVGYRIYSRMQVVANRWNNI